MKCSMGRATLLAVLGKCHAVGLCNIGFSLLLCGIWQAVLNLLQVPAAPCGAAGPAKLFQ
ncbi:hypothetical protein ANAPC5_01460 [Anaplasma phagocytophilum]|nr:hypothetical protein ANAPC5_01460 [Anaplasma phagocytophilum]